MAVKIGSARIDENSHAKGGKAGDQTGKEVSTQSWYKHSKGWRVFRAKNPALAEKIAQDMQWACDNNNIGYDQGQRNTLYHVAKPLGFNCKEVKTKCETDCSALVRVCCAYAGIMLPNFRTITEPSILLNSGYFYEMKGKQYTDSSDYLLRGDILCTKTQGHTVIVLSDGSKATPTPQPENPKTVVITGGMVNVRAKPSVNSKDVGTVYRGEKYPYTGETVNNWNGIVYKNKNSYVSGKYSKLE